MATRTEAEYLRRVAELGCIVCANMGFYGAPAEIHHVRFNQGLAQRASDLDTIPLCLMHHRTGGYGIAIHAGKKAFEENFGTEQELLKQVKDALSD